MEDYGMFFIAYGYLLPLAIMLLWIAWRVCSDLKAGEEHVSHFIWDCWPLLVPGVSLWSVCSLLLLAMDEGSHWLERHWSAWRMAGEQSRKIVRRMFGGVQVDTDRKPITKEEEEKVRQMMIDACNMMLESYKTQRELVDNYEKFMDELCKAHGYERRQKSDRGGLQRLKQSVKSDKSVFRKK